MSNYIPHPHAFLTFIHIRLPKNGATLPIYYFATHLKMILLTYKYKVYIDDGF